jgi:hypothetical protein
MRVAVQAAIATENAAVHAVAHRLHVGDVMVDGNNPLGDSINIAASPTWP